MRTLYCILFALVFELACGPVYAADPATPGASETPSSTQQTASASATHTPVRARRLSGWYKIVKRTYHCTAAVALATVVGFSIYWVAQPHVNDWRHGTPMEPIKIEISETDLSSPVEDFLAKPGRMDLLASYIQQHTSRDQIWVLLSLADEDGSLTRMAREGIENIEGIRKEEFPDDPLRDSRQWQQFMRIEPENKDLLELERNMLKKAFDEHWDELSNDLNRSIRGSSREVRVSDLLMLLETMENRFTPESPVP